MTHHDVLLLPRRKQVLFGADLASAIDGDMGTVDTSNSSAADNVGRAGLHVAHDGLHTVNRDNNILLRSSTASLALYT